MCITCNDLKGNAKDGLDEIKVLNRYLNRIRKIIYQIGARLASIRQNGKKLFDKNQPNGDEFIAYHKANDFRKKVLKARVKKLVLHVSQVDRGQ